ncbi:hypothetical protein TSL6_12670 [Sulfurovum sp. TSL6]|uniref:DUF6726 family protein n=1 Tax=Sulfurovum sp. TSL6 TaxID=2826995 RepID=UPI001CC64F50|nr:DUF6726 family protein [Sulfurovum sp. TSL6]GIU00761.1 hypothetical protein TSL6_12670 [Sulfurovum sp. TSL6]
MPNLKKSTLYAILTLLLLSGCTQIVTAPISVAGSVVGTTVDVAGSAVNAVSGSEDEDENENEED